MRRKQTKGETVAVRATLSPPAKRGAEIECLERRLLLSATITGHILNRTAGKVIAATSSPTFINLGPASKIKKTQSSSTTQPSSNSLSIVASQPLAAADSISAPFYPSQVRQAYGVNLISFNGTIGDGTGQTIAIVDAYNDPDIISDAEAFSSSFGLPQFNGKTGPTLTVLNQSGQTSLPQNSTPGQWDLEESLDVEWAHTIAPNANIVLFEATSNSDTNLFTAVRTAAAYSGVSVVSMSWGGTEFSTESSYDSYLTTPSNHTGVTFIASAGDDRAVAAYPSESPNVISVGGTSLTINSDGSYGGESAWDDGGGGVSAYETIPSYQKGKVNGASVNDRATPDVSMLADPNTGVLVQDTFYNSQYYLEVGGTSLSAPLWGGLIAIANQGRVLNSLTPMDGPSVTLPDLYTLSPSYFHDITSGNNGFPATPGYDMATGVGSPIANLLVPALAGYPTGPKFAFAGSLSSSVTAGSPIGPTVTVDVENANGTINTSDNSTITLSIDSATASASLTGTVTATAVNGVATFSNAVIDTVGTYTVEATDGSDYTAQSSSFNVTIGPTAKLVFIQQPVNAPYNTTIPTVKVAVEDNFGNVETSDHSTVTLSIGSGPTGAMLSGTKSVGDTSGIAAFSNLSLNVPGTYTLSASDGSLPLAPSAGFIIVSSTKLAFAQQPTTAAAGGIISPAITVDIEDINNNIVTADNSQVSLLIYNGPSGGTLSGTAQVAAVNGVATFSGMSLSVAGNYTLKAIDGTLTSTISTSVPIYGMAASLAFVPQPAATVVGSTVTPGITVDVEDQNGNLVANSSASVTLSMLTGPSSGALAGTVTVAAVNGVATFANIQLISPGSYTLMAASLGTTSADSSAFTVANLPGVTTSSGGTYTVTGSPGVQTLDVTAGTVTFGSDVFASLGNYTLKIENGAMAALASSQHLGQLLLLGTGTLDIASFSIIINYGSGNDPYTTIMGWVKAGYNGGAETGTGIISSTAALPANNANYSVGYVDGADQIAPGLSSGQIEVAYALYGDSTLQGEVNGGDFTIVSAGFGQAVTGGWEDGDYVGQGNVNGADFTVLAINFGKTASAG